MKADKALQLVLEKRGAKSISQPPFNSNIEVFSKRLAFVRNSLCKINPTIDADFGIYQEFLGDQFASVCRMFNKSPLSLKQGEIKKLSMNFMCYLQVLMLTALYDNSDESKEKLQTLIDIIESYFINDNGDETNEDCL